MKPADFGIDAATGAPWRIDVPESPAEAEALFTCGPKRCRLSGRACAKRHQTHLDTTSLEPCRDCPAGAARLRLIDLGAPAPVHADFQHMQVFGFQPRPQGGPMPRPDNSELIEKMGQAIERSVEPVKAGDIAKSCGVTPQLAGRCLRALRETGRVLRLADGRYRGTKVAAPAAQSAKKRAAVPAAPAQVPDAACVPPTSATPPAAPPAIPDSGEVTELRAQLARARASSDLAAEALKVKEELNEALRAAESKLREQLSKALDLPADTSVAEIVERVQALSTQADQLRATHHAAMNVILSHLQASPVGADLISPVVGAAKLAGWARYAQRMLTARAEREAQLLDVIAQRAAVDARRAVLERLPDLPLHHVAEWSQPANTDAEAVG